MPKYIIPNEIQLQSIKATKNDQNQISPVKKI